MDVAFGSLTAVLFGALTVATLLGLRRGVDPEVAILAVPAIALAVALPVAVSSAAATGPGELSGLWRYALAGAIAPGASQILFTPAVRFVGASRLGILIGTAPVVSALLAIWLLDEPFRSSLAAATVMIVVGSAGLAWDPSRPEGFRRIGLVLGALTTLLFAVFAIVIRWAADGTGVDRFVGFATTIAAGVAVILAYLLATRGRAALEGARAAAGPLLPAGVLFAASYIGYIVAYEHGRVVVVAPLTATESLWTVVFAALMIGVKRDAISGRVVTAALLVVSGGVLVGVSAP